MMTVSKQAYPNAHQKKEPAPQKASNSNKHEIMSVVSSTGQTMLKHELNPKLAKPNQGQRFSADSEHYSEMQSQLTKMPAINRERVLVEQVNSLLVPKGPNQKGFPEEGYPPRNLYDERSMITVSQEPQSRFLHKPS